MSVDPSFWQAKQSQARYEIEKKSALLDELMEREQVLIDQLLAAKPVSVLAEAAPAAADPNLQLELDEARAALAAAEQQREIDVQKTAAYWLQEIKSLREKLGAAEATAAAAASATEAAAAVAWQQGVEAAAAEAARAEPLPSLTFQRVEGL